MAKRFAVIGLGSFGFSVAKTLFEEGHEILAIDIDEDTVQRVRQHATQAIIADATQKEMLSTLGLEEMDAVVVSMGDDTNASTLITLYLRELQVKRVVAKANSDDHGKILRKVGATDVIYPEKDMAVKVARSLSTPDVLDYFPMTGDYLIAEIAPVSEFVGKTLAQLQLRTRYNIDVIGIRELVPENFVLVPRADFTIKDSDVLLVIGTREDIKKIQKLNDE
ncbi:MAG: TrkA family potassium uptake protein [Candidatus Krumholzibacteria bacterium]|nr:TrkA family potassium uptake protein [Candidatus Krumholzibacteria bacterium]